MHLDISFDPAKSLRNEIERGLPFSLVLDLDWSTAWIKEDLRKDYGEQRIVCFGLLAGRMVAVGYTPRGADRHVFSMRKANEREQTRIAPLLDV